MRPEMSVHPVAYHMLYAPSKQHVRLVLSCGQENQSTDEVHHGPEAFFQDNNISKGIVRSK